MEGAGDQAMAGTFVRASQVQVTQSKWKEEGEALYQFSSDQEQQACW